MFCCFVCFFFNENAKEKKENAKKTKEKNATENPPKISKSRGEAMLHLLMRVGIGRSRVLSGMTFFAR